MSIIHIHPEVIYVNTGREMREFSDIFEACRFADAQGPWRYA